MIKKTVKEIGPNIEQKTREEFKGKKYIQIDILRQINGDRNTDHFSFTDTIRGLIPNALTRSLKKLIQDKTKIKEIITNVYTDFNNQKWLKWLDRNEKFKKWENENGITLDNKKKRKIIIVKKKIIKIDQLVTL